MAIKLSRFTAGKVWSVIFNQSRSFQLTKVSEYVSRCLVRPKIDFANMLLGAEEVHTSEAKTRREKMDTFWFPGLDLSLSHLLMLINQSRKETLILFTERTACTQNREGSLGATALQLRTAPHAPHQRVREQALSLTSLFLMRPVGFSKLHWLLVVAFCFVFVVGVACLFGVFCGFVVVVLIQRLIGRNRKKPDSNPFCLPLHSVQVIKVEKSAA